MVTTSVLLKTIAILLTMFLPISRRQKQAKRPFIALSDWGINEKGQIVNLYRPAGNQNPIKIKN